MTDLEERIQISYTVCLWEEGTSVKERKATLIIYVCAEVGYRLCSIDENDTSANGAVCETSRSCLYFRRSVNVTDCRIVQAITLHKCGEDYFNVMRDRKLECRRFRLILEKAV